MENFEIKTAEDVFGIKLKEGKDVNVKVWQGAPDVPTKLPDYIFQTELLQLMLLWLSGKGGRNLYLTGPSGCGKTSGLEQVAAATGRPVLRVGCHRDLELIDLIGRWVVKGADKWEFHYGPLPLAMKNGHILILDEADTLQPGTAMGLNSVLDGAPLFIPETGETINPHEGFRLAATGNTNGQGDSTGAYRGTTKHNLAWGDRFLMGTVTYLNAEQEQQLLEKVVPAVPKAYREKAVKYANLVRNAFMADDGSAEKPSITLTTRGLVRWMASFEMLRNLGSKDPLHSALYATLVNKGTASDRIFFEELYRGIGVDHGGKDQSF